MIGWPTSWHNAIIRSELTTLDTQLSEFLNLAPPVLIASGAAYLIGSLPLADLITKQRSGKSIFSKGTKLAGASNVLRNVGAVPAAMVSIGDLVKGAGTILLAERLIGVEGTWLLIPAGAAIFGHWKLLFTGFRGGDGLGTLGGIILAIFPVFGVISILVALLITLGGQKMPYTSLLGTVFGYATLVALSIYYDVNIPLTLGVGGLTGLVLARALLGHKRRRQVRHWDEPEEYELGIDENSAT